MKRERGFSLAASDRKSGTDPERAEPSEAELAARLHALDRRLDRKAEQERAASAAGKPDNSGFASALSLSSVFVSAILVGAGMGWGIDRFFGVAPWGMILFMLLGFCAGTLNVMRSAGRISSRAGKQGGAGGARERTED